MVDVIEYHNAVLDHYFISALPSEIAALDAGHFMGWTRTGRFFKAFAADQPGSIPLCRIYIRPEYGDSHFYSTSERECETRAADTTRFQLETRDAMRLYPAVETTGECPLHTIAVYRLWNRRLDSNHVFTTDAAFRDALLTRGYVAEGYGPQVVSMCAPT